MIESKSDNTVKARKVSERILNEREKQKISQKTKQVTRKENPLVTIYSVSPYQRIKYARYHQT